MLNLIKLLCKQISKDIMLKIYIPKAFSPLTLATIGTHLSVNPKSNSNSFIALDVKI